MASRILVPPRLQHLDRSTSKLSELAKRVAIPGDIVGTNWGPIRDTCRDEMDIEFDGWQDGMGQLMLARNPQGLLAHTIGGFNLSAMRQIGKTYWGAASLFGLCQHHPGLLCVWTAHHTATSDETFDAMQGFASQRKVKPLIEFVHTGSGEEEIKFWNGSRVLFGAREAGFGRGIPGVDVLFFDEGQIMSQRAMQNMLATINTSWLGLHIYAGTPPKPEDNSEAWMRKRDKAWQIEDPSQVVVETDNLVWVEFGADDPPQGEEPDLDDVYQWYKNPSIPHRTPIHAVERLRENLNDDGFAREGLGLYDRSAGSIFDMARWNVLADPSAAVPDRAALVIDLSPDRKWCSIGIACEYEPTEADTLDEIDEERSLVMVKSMQGTAGVAKLVDKLDTEGDLLAIKITPGAARALETGLTKLGVEYEIMPQSEVNAAFGDFQEAIKAGTVVHLDQPELNFALVNSKSRYLQSGETQSFDRRKDKDSSANDDPDTSPAVACACALYVFGILNEPMPFIG